MSDLHSSCLEEVRFPLELKLAMGVGVGRGRSVNTVMVMRGTLSMSGEESTFHSASTPHPLRNHSGSTPLQPTRNHSDSPGAAREKAREDHVSNASRSSRL